jgi:hypothetical protein
MTCMVRYRVRQLILQNKVTTPIKSTAASFALIITSRVRTLRPNPTQPPILTPSPFTLNPPPLTPHRMMCPKCIPRIHFPLNPHQPLIIASPKTPLPIRFRTIRLVQITPTARCDVAPLLHRSVRECRACRVHAGDRGGGIDAYARDDVVHCVSPGGIHCVIGRCAAGRHVECDEGLACFGGLAEYVERDVPAGFGGEVAAGEEA